MKTEKRQGERERKKEPIDLTRPIGEREEKLEQYLWTRIRVGYVLPASGTPPGDSMSFKASETEKSSQTNHRILYFSKVSLSNASISSIHMISLIVETHKDKGGVVTISRNNRISCLAAERNKRNRLHVWEATAPGSIDKNVIWEVGVKDSSYHLLYTEKAWDQKGWIPLHFHQIWRLMPSADPHRQQVVGSAAKSYVPPGKEFEIIFLRIAGNGRFMGEVKWCLPIGSREFFPQICGP